MTTKPEFPLSFDYFVFLAQWWANNRHRSNPACCLFSCGPWIRTEFYIFKYLKRNFQRMHFMTHKNYVKFEFQFLRYSLIGTQPCSLTHVCSVVAYVVQKQSWIVFAETYGSQGSEYLLSVFFFFFLTEKVCWPKLYENGPKGHSSLPRICSVSFPFFPLVSSFIFP